MKKAKDSKRTTVSREKAKAGASSAPVLQVRMRIRQGRDIALGPGKGDLLQAIDAAGSLLAAAQSLKMSYMRAWSLVQEMQRCFREPLVEMNRGGTSRGGASLTSEGREILQLYLKMEREAQAATKSTWRKLQRRLRD